MNSTQANILHRPQFQQGETSAAVHKDGSVPTANAGQGVFVGDVGQLAKEWLDEALRLQSQDRDFAARLAQCTTPFEAAWLCGNWLSERTRLIVDCQRRLFDLWTTSIGPSAFTRQLPRESVAEEVAKSEGVGETGKG